MTKTLFFGGAFNPLTNAHLALADYARKQLGYDKVLFVPTKSHYILKTEQKTASFDEKDRLAMLEEVSENHPWMEVSSIEIDQQSQPRTYFTLKALREKDYDLKLLMGSDWLAGLETKWLYIDEILDEFGIVVMKRNGDDIEGILNSSDYLKARKDRLMILDTPSTYQAVSSSKVRALLEERRYDDVKQLVPTEVYHWLERNMTK